MGRLDVLVNNAGISGVPKKINELSTNDWDYVIDVNLKGAFLCTREALKHMIQDNNDTSSINAKKNNNYSIINISSVHESVPQPDAAPYAASKGGMEMLTKNTAMECLCIHILVTALEKTLSSNLSARLHNYIINKKTQRG